MHGLGVFIAGARYTVGCTLGAQCGIVGGRHKTARPDTRVLMGLHNTHSGRRYQLEMPRLSTYEGFEANGGWMVGWKVEA